MKNITEGCWSFKPSFYEEAHTKLDKLEKWFYDKFGDDELFDGFSASKRRLEEMMQSYKDHPEEWKLDENKKGDNRMTIREAKEIVTQAGYKIKESASGQDMDKLVGFLQKVKSGKISENGMIHAGFNLASPVGNNESKLCRTVAIALGTKTDEDDFRAALSEVGYKSASDIVNDYLHATGGQLHSPVEGVR
jgi:hypothetical protein